MKSVAFHTLGCKVNQYETEAMEELFQKNGYAIVDENQKADIYVINTCTVTNLSDRKSRQFIRKSKKINNDSLIVVVGCYSQVSPEEVERIPGVDVIIGTSQRNEIVELSQRAFITKEKINVVKSIKTYKEFEKINIDDIKAKTRAFLKIQDGCNQFCSYCIIPYARGPIRSRIYDDIEKEAEKLANAGFKEIVLTGIHVASYGKDLKKETLREVIEKISKIKGIQRIRLSSVEPNLIDDEFMNTILNSENVCDHFHLSLQSGSDSVLSRMNRKYNTQEFYNKVETIRKYMPNAGITTDIIVGFPGETHEEFQDTMNFIRKVGFSRIHVFKYSPRKGTPAAVMNDQIHGDIKSQRSDELIKLGDELTLDFNSKFINMQLPVLFEERTKKKSHVYEGYTTNYIRVEVSSEDDIIGNIVDVKFKDVESINVKGEIV